MEAVKIMIIEDEAIVAADLAARLRLAGYHVTEVVDSGEQAIANYLRLKPDIIMADIHLKGRMDGIQTIEQIRRLDPVPVIYLTAYSDTTTWERARQTSPSAYLTKPFRERDIHSAIELAIMRTQGEAATQAKQDHGTPTSLDTRADHFFIRTENGRFEKLPLEDLLYLEADRSYCRVVTRKRTITLSEPLNKLHEKIRHENLIRIHRSYVVNKTAVEAIDRNSVIINGAVIPISQSYEANFLAKIRIIH